MRERGILDAERGEEYRGREKKGAEYRCEEG